MGRASGCSKPKDHGYVAELWTRSLLAKHVRQNATGQGIRRWQRQRKQWFTGFSPLRTHTRSVRYYLEKRDPEFEAKMKVALLVYQEAALQNEARSGGTPQIITVSADEKPGLQALANTAPDLPPFAGKHPTVARENTNAWHMLNPRRAGSSRRPCNRPGGTGGTVAESSSNY
jgi:hypothetical protein